MCRSLFLQQIQLVVGSVIVCMILKNRNSTGATYRVLQPPACEITFTLLSLPATLLNSQVKSVGENLKQENAFP